MLEKNENAKAETKETTTEDEKSRLERLKMGTLQYEELLEILHEMYHTMQNYMKKIRAYNATAINKVNDIETAIGDLMTKIEDNTLTADMILATLDYICGQISYEEEKDQAEKLDQQ